MKRIHWATLFLLVGAVIAYVSVCKGSVCFAAPSTQSLPVTATSTASVSSDASCDPIWKKVQALPASTSTAFVPDARTKTADCVFKNGLPDHACTPGAVFPDVGAAQICVKGYASSARNVPLTRWNFAFAEYGVTRHASGEYEVDHLIPLEVGGSNDIANLWPELAEPSPGFHDKDVVENCLHAFVCEGKMSLAAAQSIFATNWESVWK
jgi:hypothetical protein